MLQQRRQPLTRLAIGGAALGAGALVGWFGSTLGATILFAVAIALCLPPPARRAWTSATKRVLDINVLMVIAVVGAVALGEWFEAATVVWLFGVAQEIEWFSLERARHAIRSLMAIAPAKATVRRHGQLHEVPVEDLRIGDHVIVKPGDRMPVDGVIVEGESAFDESPVTGESWPWKRDRDRTFLRGRSMEPGRWTWPCAVSPPTAPSRASFISSNTPRSSARRCRPSSIDLRAATRPRSF
jgi:Cd2+/Zn2+-exporting ATPase